MFSFLSNKIDFYPVQVTCKNRIAVLKQMKKNQILKNEFNITYIAGECNESEPMVAEVEFLLKSQDFFPFDIESADGKDKA